MIKYELNTQIENSIKDNGDKQKFFNEVYGELGTLANLYVNKEY